MFDKRYLATAIAAAFVIVSGCGDVSPPDDAADAIFVNGRIYTVDAERTWAEAVAIKDGRIVFVGSDTDARALAGSQTRVIDLRGRTMLPAFQDSHIHPISSGLDAIACDLTDRDGIAGYRAAIAEYAAANPEVEWIQGGGWLMSEFGPGAKPSRLILDELVPDRPVYLTAADGHTAWVNSRALEIAGITKDTPDPSGGIIDRDPDSGEPIGSLQERAMYLVADHVPAPTMDMRLAALRYAQGMLHRYGVTAMQDANVKREDLETYRALARRGELALHVVAALWWERDRGLEQIDDFRHLREEFGDVKNLRPIAVKIMQDGVMENYTAAMLEPYKVPSRTRGIPMIEPAFLQKIVTALDAANFQVHFHAIGDAAVRQSLDAVEAALDANGQRGNRHHLSHIQMFDPTDIGRFAELDAVANFQPLWAYGDEYVTELTVPFIGEARARWMYPMRSVQRSGGRIAFGSDWSVSTANPFPQIEVAVTRKDPWDESAEVFIPEERIDLATAIDAFTINAAFVNHQERMTGSIETGKLADLIVVDQNLFEIPSENISDTVVVLTVFGGKIVYGDPAEL